MQKFEAIVGTEVGTHIAKPATLMDVLVPTVPLVGSTANLARATAYGLGGFFFAKKKYTGNFMG